MEDLVSKFREIRYMLAQKESQPEAMYWMTEDGSDDYCYGCICKEIPGGLMGEDFEGTRHLECDGPAICAGCGKLLDYILTDSGVEYELSHFEEHPPDLSNPDQCFELSRVAHGIAWDDDKKIQRLIAVMDAAAAPKES